MQTTNVNWEDEENNRIVTLAVDFTAGEQVDLHRLTPTKVTFLCPESGVTLRSVGVHRTTGRRVLSRAFQGAGQLPELKARLMEHHPQPVPALQTSGSQAASYSPQA
jgi:hypothetical protein